MKISPSVFDKVLATGNLHGTGPKPSQPDVFGVRSLTPPSRGPYRSMTEAAEALKRAVTAVLHGDDGSE
jgi:hypothetical protein